MASITDIKRRIIELGPAQFQEFCDTLISKHDYGVINGYGMQPGTGNTTIGNPDTYFRKENGKYVFVVYTKQQKSIYSKIKDDIEKCFDPSKTGVAVKNIEEIICCHTSSNLSAGDDKKIIYEKEFQEYQQTVTDVSNKNKEIIDLFNQKKNYEISQAEIEIKKKKEDFKYQIEKCTDYLKKNNAASIIENTSFFVIQNVRRVRFTYAFSSVLPH